MIVCRWEADHPHNSTGKKTFRVRHYDGATWLWGKPNGESCLFNLPEFIDRSDDTVMVHEGEKAALAAKDHFPDYVHTAWPFGRQAVGEVEISPLAGRTCILIPDADDDFGGVRAMRDLVDRLEGIDAKPEIAEPLWSLGDGADIADICDESQRAYAKSFIEKRIDPTSLKDANQKQVSRSIPVFVESYRFTGSLNIGSDVEIAGRVANALQELFGKIIHSDGRIWFFNNTHWERFTETQLRLIVHKFDGENLPNNNRSGIKLTKQRIDSILNELTVILDQPDYFNDPNPGINCESGFIKFDERGNSWLVPHHQDHRVRHTIPGRWPRKGATGQRASTLLEMLLQGCFAGDEDAVQKKMLLAEIAGAAALGYGTRLTEPKAVVFHGETAGNGKSQILDLFRCLLPDNASTCVPLGKLSDDKYLIGLIGAHLNASDELTSAQAIASDTFKQLITGDPIAARDVYRSAIKFRPIAQHVFATNNLPSFQGGMDRGVRRRLCLLSFNRSIPNDERIPRIGLRIGEEEPDALLEWAVTGASRLIRQKAFSEPPSSQTALRNWILGSDPVLAWLDSEDEVLITPDAGEVRLSVAYGTFKKWAREEGFRESTLPAPNTFSKNVVGAGKGISRKRLSDGSYLVGLRLRK